MTTVWPTAERSPYTTAIDDTIGVLALRARGHRLLAVLALAVPIAAVVTSVARHSWRPVLLATSLVPLFALFRCLDIWLLCRWELRVVDLWRAGEIEFDDFRGAIGASHGLPPNTLAGMLDGLPRTNVIGRPATPALRALGAMTLRLIARVDALCGALRTASRSVTVAGLIIAIATLSFSPWGFVAVAAGVVEPVEPLVRRLAGRLWRRRLAAVGGSERDFLVAFAARIDWRAIRGEPAWTAAPVAPPPVGK